MKEVVYTADSEVHHLGKLLKATWRDLLSSRELAWRLFVRNTNSMYRETALGYAWALLPPLMTAVVFIYLRSNQIFTIGETALPYPVFVVSGLVFWQTFAESINCPLKITSQSANLLGRVNFQREALILAGIGEVLFNLMVRMVLLVGVLSLFSVLPKATVFFVPLGLLVLIVFGLTLGLFLLPAGVLYRDIGRGLNLLLLLWMFLSPVLFPRPNTSPVNLVTGLNPVGVILTTLREMLFIGEFSQLSVFIAISIASVLLLLVAWIFCKLSMPYLIERMAS